MNNIYFIVVSVLIIIYILYSIRKGQLSIKDSFCWVMSAIAMLLLSIFPYSIDWIAVKLNISYGPTLLLTAAIVFLIVLNFNASKRITKLQEKITDLAQELSILKEDNVISKELKKYQITYSSFQKELIKKVGYGTSDSTYFIYTPLLKRVLENAILDVKENGLKEVGRNTLLLALLDE